MTLTFRVPWPHYECLATATRPSRSRRNDCKRYQFNVPIALTDENMRKHIFIHLFYLCGNIRKEGDIKQMGNSEPHVAVDQNKDKRLAWETRPYPSYSLHISPLVYRLFLSLDSRIYGK
ncbi:hypothetical protein TNIN_483281 [Trichonephila inaurata madagascariensis]|uniref:Uncharacterized protein n=1 Tax=Trichonephila inaurata madagascariensis TaxID=2747483 RepID=A0A8X6Y4U7_9ARAC|nr:hypothetical protein TNIN_483281 [Trichonephila inaurata madagascariensis]